MVLTASTVRDTRQSPRSSSRSARPAPNRSTKHPSCLREVVMAAHGVHRRATRRTAIRTTANTRLFWACPDPAFQITSTGSPVGAQGPLHIDDVGEHLRRRRTASPTASRPPPTTGSPSRCCRRSRSSRHRAQTPRWSRRAWRRAPNFRRIFLRFRLGFGATAHEFPALRLSLLRDAAQDRGRPRQAGQAD